MDDWEYEELFDAVNKNYNKYLEKNLSCHLALARTSYDFETVQNEGLVENIIVLTALGEILLTHENIFIGYLNSINETLKKFNPNELQGHLSLEELTDLTFRVMSVVEVLNKKTINSNPNVL